MVLGSIFCVFLLGFTLAFIEPEYAFLDLLFESVSAFGTVGLTTGLTGDLSSASQLLLVLAMFIGRVWSEQRRIRWIGLQPEHPDDARRIARFRQRSAPHESPIRGD